MIIHKLYNVYNLLIVLIELLSVTIIFSISFREMSNIDDCNTDGCIDYSSLANIFHNNSELIGKCDNIGSNLPQVCEKYAKSFCSSRTYRCPYKKSGETLTDKHHCDFKKCLDCVGCWINGVYYDCCSCNKYEYTYNGFTCYISKWTYVFLVFWIVVSVIWCLMFIIFPFVIKWNDIINNGKKEKNRISPCMFFLLESIPFAIQMVTFICLYFLTLDYFGEMFDGIMEILIGLTAILNGLIVITNIGISIKLKN